MRLATGLAEDNSAHRVPQRNNAGNPKPIVCRFVRRLVKESLMSHRKEISDVTPAGVGLPGGSSLSSARIYDHLSPRMQAALFQAKKVCLFHENRCPNLVIFQFSIKFVVKFVVVNSLEKPFAFSHVFDLRAFTPLYVNHKQKTHQITT